MRKDDPQKVAREAAALRAAGDLAGARRTLRQWTEETGVRNDAHIALELAQIAIREGAWRQAEDSIAAASGDPIDAALRARLDERKAWALFRRGELKAAQKLAEGVVAGEATPAAVKADAENTLGGIAWTRGAMDEASRHTESAATFYDQAGDPTGSANAYANLGVLLCARGDWSGAKKRFEEAEAVRKENNISCGRATVLYNLGVIEFSLGNYDRAREHFEASLELGRTAGEPYEPSRAEIALAHLDLIDRNIASAAARIDETLATCECMCDDDRIQASWLQALVECERGGIEKAQSLARDAREQAKQAHLVESEIDSCLALAEAFRRANQIDEAEALLAEAQNLADRLGDPFRRGMVLLERSEIAKSRARADYRQYADQAVVIFDALGARRHMERARNLLS